MPPRRIIVIGRTGSGKSTMAARLADRLSIPYLPTDGLFWSENWGRISVSDLRPWLTQACAGEAWVTDGNFLGEQKALWSRAELAVWLDPPPWLSIARVARRNLGWWLSRRPVWGQRRIKLRRMCSGVQYAVRAAFGDARRDYERLLADFPELAVVRLRSKQDAEAWLANLT